MLVQGLVACTAMLAAVCAQSADQLSAHSYEQFGRPQPYDFGYEVKDELGSVQSRQEKADESGIVKGTYAYSDPSGVFRQVEYVADEGGFRVNMKTNEPGTSNQSPADVVIVAEEPPANLFAQKIPSSQPVARLVAGGPQVRPAVVGVRPTIKVVTPVQANYVATHPAVHVLAPAATTGHVLVKAHGDGQIRHSAYGSY